MSWLVSNWFFILFVAGIAWMHLRHGGHGNRHQPTTAAHRQSARGADDSRHAVAEKTPANTGARRAVHAGHDDTEPKELLWTALAQA